MASLTGPTSITELVSVFSKPSVQVLTVDETILSGEAVPKLFKYRPLGYETGLGGQ